MRIQHNIMAMNAYRNYNTNTSALSKNLEKLSSGYKINRAGDDAAGLAISEKMRAQITGLNAAQKNVKDGISLVKTAEGAMQEIQDMLNRMDYLATQSANGTYDDTVDRANLQKEVDALKSEIDRIAESANFNGIKLLDGKTGLNGIEITDAAAVAAKPAGDIAFGSDAFITASASGVHGVHVSPAVTATAGEFVIDLAGIMGGASKVTLATGDTITINVGTKAITYTATATASYASAGALANAIVTAFNKTVATAGAAATNAALSLGAIGSMAFTAAATDTTKIKFTFAGTVETATVATAAGGTTGGVPNTGTINKVANTSIQASDAEKFNNFINGSNLKVSATIVSKNQTKSMELHGVQGIKNSVPDDGNDRAGITVDFSKVSGLYAEGNKLTIDGTEYTISMEKAPATKATNTIYLGDVNVAANATDGAKAAAYAAEMVKQLTTKGATTARFNLTEVGAGKLHIDQKATDTDKFTEKTLKELFSAKQTNAEAAKGKGVTIDFANAKAGAKLVIGEGSTAKTFTLVEGAAVASKGEISLSNAPEELKAALGTTAYAYDPIATGAKSITIRTKDTDATAKAPVVGNTGLTLQIGDTSDSYNQLQVKTGDLHTAALGIANLDIKNPTSAAAAIQTIKDAINNVSSIRGDLGAVQNRLEHTANNLSVMAENIQDAESTIRDTDVAEEMMAYTKNNILIQSAQAMLAQANAVPQGVLQLLG